MAKQSFVRSAEKRLEEISADGDPLEALNATVDFERFRPILERAAGKHRGNESEGPASDAVLKFKMLVLQNRHDLSLEATTRMVLDRLSWMRFCGLGITDPVPDAGTLRDFRGALIKAGVLESLFAKIERIINEAGWVSQLGRMVDLELIPVHRRRP